MYTAHFTFDEPNTLCSVHSAHCTHDPIYEFWNDYCTLDSASVSTDSSVKTHMKLWTIAKKYVVLCESADWNAIQV